VRVKPAKITETSPHRPIGRVLSADGRLRARFGAGIVARDDDTRIVFFRLVQPAAARSTVSSSFNQSRTIRVTVQ
jgi:hypothetical protein